MLFAVGPLSAIGVEGVLDHPMTVILPIGLPAFEASAIDVGDATGSEPNMGVSRLAGTGCVGH